MTTATMTKPPTKRKTTGKKRFKILMGIYQERLADGTMGPSETGRVYHANGDGDGNIIETHLNLCQLFNSRQRGLQPKFERLDEVLQGQVWNPDTETLDQFAARMRAEGVGEPVEDKQDQQPAKPAAGQPQDQRRK